MFVSAAIAVASLAISATIGLDNPSFEGSKLGTWQTTGQVSVFGKFKKEFSPNDGLQQIIAFTNRSLSQRRNMAAAELVNLHQFNLDLIEALGAWDVHDGSTIRQTFTLEEPGKIAFDWALGSRTGVKGGNDMAFAVLDDAFYLLGSLRATRFTVKGRNKFIYSDYKTFTGLPALEAGQHTIILGVINVYTANGRTALLVDNFQTATVIIPEPASMVLVMAGLVAMAARRRRAGLSRNSGRSLI